MVNQMVKAYCGMFGVLKNIEYLMEYDSESKKIMGDKNIAIQFTVKNGPRANLSFAQGKAEFKEGKHKCDVLLYFSSPEHFNKMIDGKGNPILLKGFTKVKFLTGDFQKLTDRLEYYLKPSEEQLKDKTFFKINTEMTAYTAFFSVCQIANHDPNVQYMAKRIPDGKILVDIAKSIAATITVNNGHLTVAKDKSDAPRAVLSFDGLQTAHAILNNKLDSFTALGLGQLKMSGFIPMVENLNPFLDKVEQYLL